jgi:hypothetical protein
MVMVVMNFNVVDFVKTFANRVMSRLHFNLLLNLIALLDLRLGFPKAGLGSQLQVPAMMAMMDLHLARMMVMDFRVQFGFGFRNVLTGLCFERRPTIKAQGTGRIAPIQSLHHEPHSATRTITMLRCFPTSAQDRQERHDTVSLIRGQQMVKKWEGTAPEARLTSAMPWEHEAMSAVCGKGKDLSSL